MDISKEGDGKKLGVMVYATEQRHWWSCPRMIIKSLEEIVGKDTESSIRFSTRARPVKELVQINHLDEFQGQMRYRLEEGRKKYDDKSFLTDNLFTDIKEEILDVANYAYLLFERIRRLEEGESATDYLHFCRAVDLTTDCKREELSILFKTYKVCHRIAGREYHYCQKGDVNE